MTEEAKGKERCLLGWMRCGAVEYPGVRLDYLCEELLGWICAMMFCRVEKEGEYDVDVGAGTDNNVALAIVALQFYQVRSDLGSRPDDVHDSVGSCLWAVPVLHDVTDTSFPLAAAIRVSRAVNVEGS